MDEREAELRKQTRGANDHLIAAALEKRWNAKALQQLVRDTANETDEDKAEIRRFWGIRMCLRMSTGPEPARPLRIRLLLLPRSRLLPEPGR